MRDPASLASVLIWRLGVVMTAGIQTPKIQVADMALLFLVSNKIPMRLCEIYTFLCFSVKEMPYAVLT
jgi:hypothetical protein